jgi:hypothetical protein
MEVHERVAGWEPTLGVDRGGVEVVLDAERTVARTALMQRRLQALTNWSTLSG